MLEIDPATLRAMEADRARRRSDDFAGWWAARGLPSATPDYLAQLWHYAAGRARELGIDDDGRGQVSIYAVAFRLMGEMSAPQFIAVSDLLFEPGGRDALLPRLAAIAQEHA